MLTAAGGLDYVEHTPLVSREFSTSFQEPWGDMTVTYFYATGVFLAVVGIAMWLPSVMRLAGEIEQRKIVEKDLRALTVQLNETAVKAEEATRSKNEFLATMSHELRTPLNAIIGYSQMINQSHISDGAKTVEYTKIIEDCGMHLLSIINDILDISKLEAGRLSLSLGPVDVADVVNIAKVFCEARALDKRITITDFIDPQTVNTDERLLKQIVINLFSNAVKFSNDGTQVTARGMKLDDRTYRLVIEDQGIGMTERELRSALEPFRQVDNALSRKYEGTGLGLPIVQRFSDLLGIKFKITSEKDVGTKVTLDINLAQNEMPA